MAFSVVIRKTSIPSTFRSIHFPMIHTYRTHALRALIVGATLIAFSSCAPSRDYVPSDWERFASLDSAQYPLALETSDRADMVSARYRDPATRQLVLDFFADLTRSGVVAKAILDQSEAFNVPPSLAFALAHEESDYTVVCINRNRAHGSVDIGVFQLNTKTFPDKKVDYLMDPDNNIRLGVAHLSFCLDQGRTDVAALAMYNAGLTRVTKGGTPRSTLDYISRILAYRANLEALFEVHVAAKTGKPAAPRLASIPAPRSLD